MASRTCENCGAALVSPLFPCLHCAVQGNAWISHSDGAPPPQSTSLKSSLLKSAPSQSAPTPDPHTAAATAAALLRAGSYQPTVRPVRPAAPTVSGGPTEPALAAARSASGNGAQWVAALVLLALVGALALGKHATQGYNAAASIAPAQAGSAAADGTQRRAVGRAVEGTRSGVAPVFRGSDTTDARLAYAPAPRYPRGLRHQGVQGRVLLQIDVDAVGRATSIRVISSSGHRALDQAALNAAQQWRFTPATRNGRSVDATLNVPITFSLE